MTQPQQGNKPNKRKNKLNETQLTVAAYLDTFPITLELYQPLDQGGGSFLDKLIFQEPSGKTMMTYLSKMSIDVKNLWLAVADMTNEPDSTIEGLGFIDSKACLEVMAPLLA